MVEKKEAAKQEVAVKNESGLPAYLQSAQKTTSVGNVNREKLVIPRIKLLQGLSPEIETHNDAKQGTFWHTILEQSFGNELKFVPVKMRRTFVLWAPRNDERGILARASDGLNWDEQYRGLEFKVKPKNHPHEVTYKIGNTVNDRIDGQPALSEFGSGIPGDPKSMPAASETFEWLVLLPDYMDIGPVIILNARSSWKPSNLLVSKIEMRPVEHYAQQYIAKAVKDKNMDGEEYWNYQYTADGYPDEAVYHRAKELFEYYSKNDFTANDEGDDGVASEGPSRPKGSTSSSRF